MLGNAQLLDKPRDEWMDASWPSKISKLYQGSLGYFWFIACGREVYPCYTLLVQTLETVETIISDLLHMTREFGAIVEATNPRGTTAQPVKPKSQPQDAQCSVEDLWLLVAVHFVSLLGKLLVTVCVARFQVSGGMSMPSLRRCLLGISSTDLIVCQRTGNHQNWSWCRSYLRLQIPVAEIAHKNGKIVYPRLLKAVFDWEKDPPAFKRSVGCTYVAVCFQAICCISGIVVLIWKDSCLLPTVKFFL